MSVKADRKTVRAGTKFVQSWPMERAQLIGRHERNLRNAEIAAKGRADMALRNGREAAFNEMANSLLSDSNFRGEFMRYAARDLGERASRHVSDWMSTRVDPILAQQNRVRDQILSMANLSANLSADFRNVSCEPVLHVSVDFPPMQFHFAEMVPRAGSSDASQPPNKRITPIRG